MLRVLNWLKSFGHEEIHLAAKGWGAIPSTFAALLSDALSQVTLKNALVSFSDIAENEEYNWPLSSLLPGVLKTFDLSDCYNELKAKNLRQIEPKLIQAIKEIGETRILIIPRRKNEIIGEVNYKFGDFNQTYPENHNKKYIHNFEELFGAEIVRV